MDPEPFLNIADYARAARGKLTKDVCDYYEGGALDEITLRDNTAPPDAVPLATDKGTTADLTGRVQVKTLKIVSPNCL